jgi:excisionase family DNA binding protein
MIPNAPPPLHPSARDLPLLLTRQQAADLLHVDPRTIGRMIADGRLARAMKTSPTGSGRVLIRRDDLLRLAGLEAAGA